MDLELLQSISVAVSQVRTVETVLKMIVDGLVEKAGLALARIWLIGPGDICATCPMGHECPSRMRCLHLAASAGRSQVDGHEWKGIEGSFRRIPLGVRKIGQVGSTGNSFLIEDAVLNPTFAANPDWVRSEGIHGFASHPLIFGQEILGVLGAFGRIPFHQEHFKWLRVFADQAAVSIANARAFEEIHALQEQLKQENDYLRSEVNEGFSGLLGHSPALKTILSQIELVAPTEASVLILGESGTGKELIARALHDRSNRVRRALVKVNCASIPHELFESEFFGHAKGSFTGALRDRVGRFQLADGGTLFLDEIAEIPLELQSKLLRVLQEGQFERVGEDRTRQVSVRVIAATNRNLEQEVEAGRFRQDLYFRLSVFPLKVPPLRDRLDDIPVLASKFLEQAARRMHSAIPTLTREHVQELTTYPWPGNVRELQNVIERAVILARDGTLHFGLNQAGGPSVPGTERQAPVSTRKQLLELERRRIVEALQQSGGKIYGADGAAELLGMRPTTLTSKIAALKIKRR
ncbi:MAG TPA: sigma 54-interacting transcriptional regulator [Bryobacteraceae bacterium]|nr:sigma 54-interacting transcriptional regulator [Bryobacteraceae bacterium]